VEHKAVDMLGKHIRDLYFVLPPASLGAFTGWFLATDRGLPIGPISRTFSQNMAI